MFVRAGLGFHNVEVDISIQVADFAASGLNLTRVEATVMNPNEGMYPYDIDVAGADFFTRDITSAAGITQTHTLFRFRHEFIEHGEHRIAVRFWLDSGEYITSSEAVRVRCGDGLHRD